MTTAAKPLTVSSGTARFIECLDMVGKLTEKVYDALSEMYTSSVADNMIKDTYFDQCCALRTTIEKYLIDSINDHIGMNDFEEI